MHLRCLTHSLHTCALSICFVLSGCLAELAQADTGLQIPVSATLDLTGSSASTTPLWLSPPVLSNGSVATMDLAISPFLPGLALLITVSFEERESGYLRVAWQDEGGAEVISNNLYEGIDTANCRTVLLPADGIRGPGTLTFQSSGSQLGIYRVKLEWLEGATTWQSPAHEEVRATDELGKTRSLQDLSGGPVVGPDVTWFHQLLTVLVGETPQRAEDGVDFGFLLKQIPARMRLEAEVNGLPFGAHLVVWFNQVRSGILTSEVPDLADTGYLTLSQPSPSYAGWRRGSFYVPVGALKQGENRLQLSLESDTADSINPAPWSLKNIKLEIDYGSGSTFPVSPGATAASSASTDTME